MRAVRHRLGSRVGAGRSLGWGTLLYGTRIPLVRQVLMNKSTDPVHNSSRSPSNVSKSELQAKLRAWDYMSALEAMIASGPVTLDSVRSAAELVDPLEWGRELGDPALGKRNRELVAELGTELSHFLNPETLPDSVVRRELAFPLGRSMLTLRAYEPAAAHWKHLTVDEFNRVAPDLARGQAPLTSAEAERFADEVCWAAFALTLADPEDLVPTELITAVAGVLQSTKPESAGTGLRGALRRLTEIATFLGSCHQDMEAAMEVRAALDTIVVRLAPAFRTTAPHVQMPVGGSSDGGIVQTAIVKVDARVVDYAVPHGQQHSA